MAERRVAVKVDADVSPFIRGLTEAGVAAKGFAHELESADGRMANLVQTGLALAPALVPLGAAAVPAIAGLTAQLGAAAAAAGVGVLAFQGVGDALKAMQTEAIDPSDEHLKKMQDTLNALGPAGQNFVHFLQQLRPEMQDFQDIAQMGLFPGLQDGINEALRLAPEVKQIIRDISTTMGNLASEAGTNLASPRWVEFIKFLDREATPTLTAMGKTMGYVVEGLANMMQAFDPMADDFTNGMVKMARSFRDWTDGLSSSDGFQHFLDYVRDSGPKALDALAALADALVSLVSAAAPVGSVVLPLITDLANGLSALADSSVGPVLISVAAAVGTLGRSLALLKTVGLRGDGESMLGKALNADALKGSLPAMREAAVATKELQVAETEAAAAHARYIGALRASSVRQELIPGAKATDGMTKATDELIAANEKQATAAEKVRTAEESKSTALRRSLTGATRAAAVVGGLALATSDYAQKSGLANTASYALMGTIAGPWGTAVGGAIGLVQDFTSGSLHAGDSLKLWNHELAQNESDLTNYVNILGQAQSQLTDMSGAIPTSFGDALLHSLNPSNMKINFQALFGDLDNSAIGKQADQVAKLQSNYDDLVLAVNEVGRGLGGIQWGKSTTDVGKMNDILARSKPAMDALGYSVKDLMQGVRDGSITVMVERIKQWNENADSARGRTRAVAESFKNLDSAMYSTAQSAQGVYEALDALLSPQMNLSQATDEWITALRHLGKDLDKNNKSLNGNSDAAIKNRAAIRDRVTSLEQVLQAEADAGASSAQLSKKLQSQRAALIDAGAAAGISRKQMNAYLNTLGLTPKVVRTIINADTTQAERALAEARRELAAMDGAHATAIMEIHTVRTGAGGQGAGYTPSADGSTVPKDGGPYGDRYPYLLAPGEEVISNRSGQADKWRPLLKAINAGHLADGGTVRGLANGGTASRMFTRADGVDALNRTAQQLADTQKQQNEHLKHELDTRKKLLENELKRDEHEVERDKKRLDALKQELQTLEDSRRQLMQQVASQFKTDIFGGNLDLMSAAKSGQLPSEVITQALNYAQANGITGTTEEQVQAYFDSLSPDQLQALQAQAGLGQLKTDASNAHDFRKALRKAKRHGLSGGLLHYLEASGNLGAAQQFANMSADQIAAYERAYKNRNYEVHQTARMVGNDKYAAAIHDQSKAVAHQTRVLEAAKAEAKETNQALHRMEHRISNLEKAIKHVGQDTAKALDGVAANSQRRNP